MKKTIQFPVHSYTLTDFSNKMDDYFKAGWRIVPGTVVIVADGNTKYCFGVVEKEQE